MYAGGLFGTASSDWVTDYHFDTSLDDSVNSFSGSQISFDVVRANNEVNNKLVYSTQKLRQEMYVQRNIEARPLLQWQNN